MTKYKKIRFSILFLIGLLCLSSCDYLSVSKEGKYLENALKMAGENRSELEKVLNHYADNPERLKAAKWLISNMPLHHSKTGPELSKYRRYFEMAADHTLDPQIINDSLDSIYGVPDLSKLEIVYDILTLDSAYLVENIDMAFEARERWPWAKNVRWEDFLEFVLPYRLGDEPLTNWRQLILEEYGKLIDSIASLPGAATPRIASDLLYKEWIGRKNFKWTPRLPGGPRIGPAIVEWKTGTCREEADGICYLLRAAGLPATLHIAPMRGDLNDNHTWEAVYDSDGSPWLLGQNTDSAYKSKMPAAKILSETFSINRDVAANNLNIRLANPSLINPFVRDETEWYLHPDKKEAFKIPLRQLDGISNGDTAYIALSSRMEWIPVGMGVAKNDSVNFGYVGDRTVCVVGIMKSGKFMPKSFPFKTTKKTDNSLHYFIPREIKPINLYSKFNLTVTDFAHRMIDCCFEVSESPDFSKVDTIYQITECPKRLYTTVDIDALKKYRYVRYKSAEKRHCSVAMISFYENAGDTLPMAGKIINAQGFHPIDDNHEYRNAWDGNPYTSVEIEESSGGWTGLDLGRPRKIAKIVYSPRNRGNFIQAGYTYELFYYDVKDGWISLGQQKAYDDMISMNAPKGALLYLHCLDAGKEERIFEYDIDKDLQIYW